MVEELGIMPPEDTMAAAKGGFVTFCSFLFFGCIPLIVYVITAIALGTEKSAEKVRIHPIVSLGLFGVYWDPSARSKARSQKVHCARVPSGM